MAETSLTRLSQAVAAVCPIVGLSVPTFGSSVGVVIQFDPLATPAQQVLAQNVVATFDWSNSAYEPWAAAESIMAVIPQNAISSTLSRQGKLFGCGTGALTLVAGFTGPVLWFRNDHATSDFLITKLIFGWNGGTAGKANTIASLISYNTTIPTVNATAISFQNENLKYATATLPGTTTNLTARKWNGIGTVGMTGSTGGFAQIPNRLGNGNTSLPIDGEIVLGNGNSMAFSVTPEAAGIFHVSVVGYFLPAVPVV